MMCVYIYTLGVQGRCFNSLWGKYVFSSKRQFQVHGSHAGSWLNLSYNQYFSYHLNILSQLIICYPIIPYPNPPNLRPACVTPLGQLASIMQKSQ